MNWGDFLFGIWIGITLTVVVELAALVIWAVLYDLFSRVSKLEDAGREEE